MVNFIRTFIPLAITPVALLLDFFLPIVAYLFVNWWAPLFATYTVFSNDGRGMVGYKLPVWLYWFDTFDADLDQGTRDGSISGTSTYWNRVKWLNRNSAYGFSYWLLGTTFFGTDWRVVRYEETSKQLTFVAISKNGHFNIHVTRLGLRFKFGWKAWNYYDKATGKWKNQPWGPVWRVPFVFSITLA